MPKLSLGSLKVKDKPYVRLSHIFQTNKKMSYTLCLVVYYYLGMKEIRREREKSEIL